MVCELHRVQPDGLASGECPKCYSENLKVVVCAVQSVATITRDLEKKGFARLGTDDGTYARLVFKKTNVLSMKKVKNV